MRPRAPAAWRSTGGAPGRGAVRSDTAGTPPRRASRTGPSRWTYRGAPAQTLGESLIEHGWGSEEELARAIELRRTKGLTLEAVLVQQGLMGEEEFLAWNR
jgi:hypothetical protein